MYFILIATLSREGHAESFLLDLEGGLIKEAKPKSYSNESSMNVNIP